MTQFSNKEHNMITKPEKVNQMCQRKCLKLQFERITAKQKYAYVDLMYLS